MATHRYLVDATKFLTNGPRPWSDRFGGPAIISFECFQGIEFDIPK